MKTCSRCKLDKPVDMFEAWDKKCTKTVPSIDRIDPNIGYLLNNIQWLTHSDNARRARRKVK